PYGVMERKVLAVDAPKFRSSPDAARQAFSMAIAPRSDTVPMGGPIKALATWDAKPPGFSRGLLKSRSPTMDIPPPWARDCVQKRPELTGTGSRPESISLTW